MSGTFDWASQLRHSKKGNYPSWKILAHARLKITGEELRAAGDSEIPGPYDT